jgi:nicotinamidase-related amidase
MSSEIALLVIDVQGDVVGTAYHKDEVVRNIQKLLEQARERGVPVIYVQHDGSQDLVPYTPGWQILPEVVPRADEVVVRKESPDAFHQTRLQEELEARGIKRLVIVGGQTEVCVCSTARRAVSLGYDVLLVNDAHTTIDSRTLSAAQIIAFYNEALNGFWAGDHVVRVHPTREIIFQA